MTTNKVASIVSHAPMCSDDGRALTLEWLLFLNDFNGVGFWHGGPSSPNHGTRWNTEEEAKEEAARLGYKIISVQWG